MTDYTIAKKLSGIPPGRCIHTQLGGTVMSENVGKRLPVAIAHDEKLRMFIEHALRRKATRGGMKQ